MQIMIILPVTKQFKKKNLFTKPPFFSLLFIGTIAEKKQDTSLYESVLFYPVLTAYPTLYSWIITATISLGDLSRQICMFNL